MVKDVEGTFQVGDQTLYTRSWLPDDGTPTKAKLVLIHGFSDHMGNYEDFGRAMAGAGIAVHGVDQRGWGKSVTRPAERGRTGGTETVVGDIAAFVRSHLESSGSLPVFVMGHSLGGGAVLALASSQTHEATVVSRVRGWLLEAPFLGFFPSEAPSTLKVTVGRFAGRFFPHRHLAHKIPAQYLSRDEAFCAKIAADDLCHDLGTLEGLAATLDRTAELSDGKMSLAKGGDGPAVKSLWIGHGTVDKAVSYDASRKWFETHATDVPDKEYRSYEGWFHQLHSDPEKETYFGHVTDWILKRVDGGAAPAAVVEGSGAKKDVAAAAAAPVVEEPKAKTADDKPEAKL